MVGVANDSSSTDRERDLLVKCIGDAYDSLIVIPGIDANGPVLVWFAEKLYEASRKSASAYAG